MTARWFGVVLLAAALGAALAAPLVAPQSPRDQYGDLLNAPPMRIRIVGADGRWHRPFIYPLRLVDRLESRYDEDRSRPQRLRWFSDGKLVSVAAGEGPLLLLGADRLGRDVFARLLYGARASLGVAVVGALGALLIGALIGGIAGYVGGRTDELLMRLADFVLVLPAVYVILALRAVMPLVIDPARLFILMSSLLAVVGWPYAARGVRAIVAVEREREYAVAARSLGAGHVRLLGRHLLPATRGFLGVQATLLVPAFVLAEATLSFVGLGFAEPVPSWGNMLEQASTLDALITAPWLLLSPALAIVLVVLGVHLFVGSRPQATILAAIQRDR